MRRMRLRFIRTGDILAVGVAGQLGFGNGGMGTRLTSNGQSAYQSHEMFVWPLAGVCAFGRKKDTPGAYTMALEAFARRRLRVTPRRSREFHIVGGLHPDLPFQIFS